MLPSFLRSTSQFEPPASLSPLVQGSTGQSGGCSQSVTASFYRSIMGPLHRLQSFSRSLFWHGSSPWTAVPSGKSAPALACDPLWSAGKTPAPAPEAIPPTPSSLTLVLRGLLHFLPHSSLPCSILPFLTDTSTEVPPASPTCSAVSRGGSAAELPGSSCVLHRATHTWAPELNTEAQTKSCT